MAQIEYRANLSATVFPTTLAKAGRSVINPQADQNFDRRIDPAGDFQPGSVGIPQVIYLENVLPTPNGYQSVGFLKRMQHNTLFAVYAAVVLPILSNGILTRIYAYFLGNNTVVYTINDVNTSVFTASVPAGFHSFNPSFATVRGILYCCTVDPGNTDIYTVTLSGTTLTFTSVSTVIAADLVGQGSNIDLVTSICGSYNYLILCTADKIFWSSTTLATEFTASLVNGAGNIYPTSVRGKMNFLSTNSFGFYIFCSENVIYAEYTGNARYPWKFREVSDSGGVNLPESIAAGNSSDIQYVITNEGHVQTINKTQAELIAPEVTDFLTRVDKSDTFDQLTNLFSTRPEFRDEAYRKIFYINDRYIVVAFSINYTVINPGDPSETFSPGGNWEKAFVFDLALRRYGVVKQNFTHIYTDKSKIFFIKQPTINTANIEVFELLFERETSVDLTFKHNAVVLMGKFQYVRSNWISVDGVYVESVPFNVISLPGSRNFSAWIYPTLDGKTFQTAVQFYDASSGGVNSLNYIGLARQSCENFSILLKGAYDLNTVSLTFHAEGDR